MKTMARTGRLSDCTQIYVRASRVQGVVSSEYLILGLLQVGFDAFMLRLWGILL